MTLPLLASTKGRRLAAGVVAILGAVPAGLHVTDTLIVLLPLLAVVGAAFMIHRPSLGPQLLARAAWWANALLGFFLCVVGGHSERISFCFLLVGCGLALMLVGDEGLGEARERDGFAASSFVTTLMLAMVFALADTFSLVLWSALAFEKWRAATTGFVLMLGAIAMIVGFVGLYRAKTWGLVVNVITNLAVAAIVASDVLPRMKDDLVVLLCSTAAIQVVLPLPMIWTLRRGSPPITLRAWHKRWALRAFIGTMMALGLFLVVRR